VLLLEDAAKKHKSKEVSEPRRCTCMHGGEKQAENKLSLHKTMRLIA